MKVSKAISYGIFLVAVGTIATTTAFADVITIQLSFDQNGSGTYQDVETPTQNGYSADSGSLMSVLAADPYCVSNPGSCVGGNVLIYELPEFVLSGAVDIGSPGDSVGSADPDPAGVLFFTNSAGVNDAGLDANLMVYYTLAGQGTLASTGFSSDATSLLDEVDENADGSFQWLPDTQTYPLGNEYDGLVTTPEPGSVMLLGIGLVGLGLIARKRRVA